MNKQSISVSAETEVVRLHKEFLITFWQVGKTEIFISGYSNFAVLNQVSDQVI